MRAPPSPKTSWTRLYGGAVGVGLIGLMLLAAALWLLLNREQADAILVHLVRRGRSYGPGHYVFYVGLVTSLGLFMSGLAVWSLLAGPASERRLNRHLSDQLGEIAERNTRTID